MMKIEFQKKSGKPNVLKCIRTDGTSSWTSIHQGLEIHDLAHYAAEFILRFDEAFYGLVSKGYDISDFEAPREKRPKEILPVNLPLQSQQIEHLVNLLQIDFLSTDKEFNLLDQIKNILSEKSIPFPKILDEIRLQQIKTLLKDLMQQWHSLKPGETLHLNFNIG